MNENLDGLKTRGSYILHQKTGIVREKTFIIIGVARSGTSMVASSLYTFGVFLGNRNNRAVYEDAELAEAIEQGAKREAIRLIEARNHTHDVWGIKRPAIFKFLPAYLKYLRNPHFIVTFRDPAAIAERNMRSMYLDYATCLKNAADDAQQLIRFLTKHRFPTLVISYEKAMMNPKDYLNDLAAFCDLDISDEQYQAAHTLIESGPASYLDHARLKYQGEIEQISESSVTGWVVALNNPEPVLVRVMAKDQILAKGVASGFRPEYQDKGKQKGYCGFHLKFKKKDLPDDIKIIVGPGTYELESSS